MTAENVGMLTTKLCMLTAENAHIDSRKYCVDCVHLDLRKY